MDNLITAPGHKITAEDVEQNCPEQLQKYAPLINTHLEKARKYKEKSAQNTIAAGQYLAEAQKLCDRGGFKAFREKLCPNLAKSRAYELLKIATRKKSPEEIRATTRERVAKHRANRRSSVTVTETSRQDYRSFRFTSAFLEVARVTKGQAANRFGKSFVNADDLVRVGKHLLKLAKIKKSDTAVTSAIEGIPPHRSAEATMAKNAVNDEERAAA
jgi:hypothetical protein